MEWIFMRGTSPDKRRFSTFAEVTRERLSNFWRGGELVFMILESLRNHDGNGNRTSLRKRINEQYNGYARAL